jgi:hypothetical protein
VLGCGRVLRGNQLTAPVSDNRVYAYNQPHLYHLARLDEQYPRYAAVIPLLQEQLPQEMVAMVEVMKLDIHASEQESKISFERVSGRHDERYVNLAPGRFLHRLLADNTEGSPRDYGKALWIDFLFVANPGSNRTRLGATTCGSQVAQPVGVELKITHAWCPLRGPSQTASATRANENIPTRHRRVQTTLGAQ